VKPAEYRKAFTEFHDNADRPAFATNYSEEELSEMGTVLSDSGKSGVAVHDHGDGRIEGTALFNNGDPSGSGLAMLAHAVESMGVNYVECFGGTLNTFYARLGFVEDTRTPFNAEYAPPDWNYERDDHPDYVTMKLPEE
jgi:hypothetical protein